MESTAQYWRSVWLELEPHMCLHLAQAFSNRAARAQARLQGRGEAGATADGKGTNLSLVPNGEQRIWRNLTRMKLQLVRDRVRLQSQIESLLEEMRNKLSVVVTDLLGSSGLRILHALGNGETDAKSLALLGDDRWKCTEEQLVEALTGRSHPMHRQMLALEMERLRLLYEHIAKLNNLIAQAMKPHQNAVIRLAEVRGLGIDSAQQIIAEIGVTASTLPSAAELTSWVGPFPGRQESAQENSSSRSAKGNKYMRRVLNQAAHAARSKGTHFEAVFRGLLPRPGCKSAVWAIAHRLCRLGWKILHEGIRYIEQGTEAEPKLLIYRAQSLARQLANSATMFRSLPPTGRQHKRFSTES